MTQPINTTANNAANDEGDVDLGLKSEASSGFTANSVTNNVIANNPLDNTPEADTLTGQSGEDKFEFLLQDDSIADNDDASASGIFANGGVDVITNFDPGEDILVFDEEFFDNLDNFSVSEDGEGGTMISYEGSEFLNLKNVDPDDFELL
ncbi:hypothetical protein PCC7418_1228 [Halothece sp. PCC 7418]|uniref:hypothetical protein n=1 Tax=Halothece sp. (strain PCC 7418) TaxID=65093 RepID=UPI0002A0854B|nr:hypothetical protein [Halothece sp. PCC 7418]AFZ43430.1 hypothetical protein PCC7418_1228 [Halothece sp. PCC 7418]